MPNVISRKEIVIDRNTISTESANSIGSLLYLDNNTTASIGAYFGQVKDKLINDMRNISDETKTIIILILMLIMIYNLNGVFRKRNAAVVNDNHHKKVHGE